MAIQTKHRFRQIEGTVAELTALDKVYRSTDRVFTTDEKKHYLCDGSSKFSELKPLAVEEEPEQI